MRKGILTFTIALTIAGLLLGPKSTSRTAVCFDCAEVHQTCEEAGDSLYVACRAGGASHEACWADAKAWMNMCSKASGCQPIYY